MENFFSYIIAMTVTLGLLIFVHELGHFLTAKKFGIGVQKFSLGFGPKIIGKKWGETEYLISAFPLGGYVKLEGEDPDDDVENTEKSFSAKPPFVKLLVAASGPVFNIIFAIIILAVLYMSGITMLSPIVGDVEKDSPALKAGLRYGDEIVKIGDKDINAWDDLTSIVHESAGKKLLFTISRKSERFQKEIIPGERVVTNVLNEREKVGLIGIKPFALDSAIGGILRESPAEKAGMKPGDRVVSVDGSNVEAYSELQYMGLGNLQDNKINLVIERRVGEEDTEKISFAIDYIPSSDENNITLPEYLGIESTELYVGEVEKESIGEKTGIKAYDKIVKVNGKELSEWMDLAEIIASNALKEVSLSLLRHGEEINLSVTPDEIEDRDIMDNRIKVGTLGLVSANGYTEVRSKNMSFNPVKSFAMAVDRTVTLTGLMFKGIYKMITGEVSSKAISGPIAIAKMAGDQAKKGLSNFASFVAFISINLGIINFIPLGTITDGGLILLFITEAIIRKPVNEKLRNVTQYIGLALIFLIMGYAIYNDFNRYLLDIIGFFRNIAGG